MGPLLGTPPGISRNPLWEVVFDDFLSKSTKKSDVFALFWSFFNQKWQKVTILGPLGDPLRDPPEPLQPLLSRLRALFRPWTPPPGATGGPPSPTGSEPD